MNPQVDSVYERCIVAIELQWIGCDFSELKTWNPRRQARCPVFVLME